MILKKVKPKQAFKGYKVINMKFFQADDFIVDWKEQLVHAPLYCISKTEAIVK